FEHMIEDIVPSGEIEIGMLTQIDQRRLIADGFKRQSQRRIPNNFISSRKSAVSRVTFFPIRAHVAQADHAGCLIERRPVLSRYAGFATMKMMASTVSRKLNHNAVDLDEPLTKAIGMPANDRP